MISQAPIPTNKRWNGRNQRFHVSKFSWKIQRKARGQKPIFKCGEHDVVVALTEKEGEKRKERRLLNLFPFPLFFFFFRFLLKRKGKKREERRRGSTKHNNESSTEIGGRYVGGRWWYEKEGQSVDG